MKKVRKGKKMLITFIAIIIAIVVIITIVVVNKNKKGKTEDSTQEWFHYQKQLQKVEWMHKKYIWNI